MSIDETMDRIEQTVDISAPAEVVWDLVSEPGWWINDGALVPHQIDDHGSHVVVHDPVHGAFPLEVVAQDPPRYVAYRWMGDGTAASPASLVEFTIAPHADGVRLTVVESGLSKLGEDLDKRRRVFEQNTQGWQLEMELARAACDTRAADSVPATGSRA
ncbi:MAG TPA: SRPBCC domain-containing protein [Propionibacteriaceae bacterium]